MTATSGPAEQPRAPEPLGRLLLVTVIVLAAASILLLVAPQLQFVVVAPGLDIVLNTMSALTAGAVAGLAWVRFQERRRPGDLLEAAAVLILCTSGAVSIAAPLLRFDHSLGMSLESPGQAPLYIWGIGRAIAAATLVTAASGTSVRGRRWSRVRAERPIAFQGGTPTESRA